MALAVSTGSYFGRPASSWVWELRKEMVMPPIWGAALRSMTVTAAPLRIAP